MTRLLSIILIINLTIAGCSSFDEVGKWVAGGEDNIQPPAPLTDFEPRAEILKLWDRDTGSGSDDQYLKLSPAITQGKIFVADNEGEINAINTTNGNVIWDKDLDLRISGGPGSDGTLVLVGTSEGEVLALNSEAGEILWRSKVSSEILAAPQTEGNVVVVRTVDGKIYGLSATAGTRLWIYDRTVPALTLRGTSAPVISDNLVIAGFDGGRMAAIELQTGKLIWETRIAVGSGRSELERMVDIDSEPLVINGIIYVATFQGRIAAVDLDTGRILWTRDISSYAGLCVDDKNIYVTDDNSHIWALDRISGNSVWKQEKLEARTVTAPAAINELIVVGDVEGYLHWLDKSSGQFVARTNISNEKIIAPPISTGDVVYAYSSDGTLGAYTNHPIEYISEKIQAIETKPETTIVDATDEPQIVETETEATEQETTKQDKDGFWNGVWDVFTGGDEDN